MQKKNAKMQGNKKGNKAKKKWGGADGNKQKTLPDKLISNMKSFESFEKGLNAGKQFTLVQIAESLNITRSCARVVCRELVALGKMKKVSQFSDSIWAGVAAA